MTLDKKKERKNESTVRNERPYNRLIILFLPVLVHHFSSMPSINRECLGVVILIGNHGPLGGETPTQSSYC